MPVAQQQPESPSADLEQTLARIRAAAEELPAAMVTPRSRNRAKLVLREIRSLERVRAPSRR